MTAPIRAATDRPGAADPSPPGDGDNRGRTAVDDHARRIAARTSALIAAGSSGASLTVSRHADAGKRYSAGGATGFAALPKSPSADAARYANTA